MPVCVAMWVFDDGLAVDDEALRFQFPGRVRDMGEFIRPIEAIPGEDLHTLRRAMHLHSVAVEFHLVNILIVGWRMRALGGMARLNEAGNRRLTCFPRDNGKSALRTWTVTQRNGHTDSSRTA